MERGQPGVFGTGKRPVTWMRLNGYTETGKMLNLSISLRSDFHLAAPASQTAGWLIQGQTGMIETSFAPASHDGRIIRD